MSFAIGKNHASGPLDIIDDTHAAVVLKYSLHVYGARLCAHASESFDGENGSDGPKLSQ